MNKPKASVADKMCPFLSAASSANGEGVACQREACMLFMPIIDESKRTVGGNCAIVLGVAASSGINANLTKLGDRMLPGVLNPQIVKG